MNYSHEVETMCPVKQGVAHGAAPIPEEAKWVKAKEITDARISFVSLVDKAANKRQFLIVKDEEGKAAFTTYGKIIKTVLPEGQKRYDFQFVNKRGYKITVEGLSEKFNPEYWNYAKLISGVLRYRMPVAHVIKLVNQLQLTSETLNTWRVGVERALKKYLSEENGIENKENGIDHKETEDEIDEQ